MRTGRRRRAAKLMVLYSTHPRLKPVAAEAVAEVVEVSHRAAWGVSEMRDDAIRAPKYA